MARQIYTNDVDFSAYSLEHRKSHGGIAMVDIDKVASCISCLKPLFLAELCRHKGTNEDYKKKHYSTKELARMAGLPGYVIWYHEGANRKVYKLSVRKITPEYSKIQHCSWDQWVSFLASRQVKHFKDCPRQEIFLNKLKNLTPEQLQDYAEILPS